MLYLNVQHGYERRHRIYVAIVFQDKGELAIIASGGIPVDRSRDLSQMFQLNMLARSWHVAVRLQSLVLNLDQSGLDRQQMLRHHGLQVNRLPLDGRRVDPLA